jgi:hypothetical protein
MLCVSGIGVCFGLLVGVDAATIVGEGVGKDVPVDLTGVLN